MKNALSDLVDCGRQFYERQWMYGMSGNLSVRLSSNPLSFAITASGINKGHMSEKDLIRIKDSGREASITSAKGTSKNAVPSSETVVHQAVYRALPGAGAVFHVHPVYSTLISKLYGDPNRVRMLKVEGVMMMKGMIGAKEVNAEVAILPNWPDPSRIAQDLTTYIQSSARVLSAVLVYDHGLTGWGATPEQARNHLEIIEYTCQYLFLNRLITR
jgi:methylthioribulose-1-phosphate dehydratase